MTKTEEFQIWWPAYVERPDCPLKRRPWSFEDIDAIKDAMKDAYLRKPVDKDLK